MKSSTMNAQKHDLIWWYDKLGLIAAVAGLCLAIIGYGEQIHVLLIIAVLVGIVGLLMTLDTISHNKGWVK